MEFDFTFSVIIATYNRPAQLKRCLQTLTEQNFSANDFEVVVVNDGGEISLKPLETYFKHAINLTLIKQKNSGPATARNRGASLAKGRYLAFIDDDCQPEPEWLYCIYDKITQHTGAMIGGKIMNDRGNGIFGTASQMILDLVYQFYNSDPKEARFFSACNMAVPTDRFRELGGFNTSFRTAEDRELCSHWVGQGFSMIYAADAVVVHVDHVFNLFGYIQRYFAYGRGARRFHKSQALKGSASFNKAVTFHAHLGEWLLYPFSQTRELKVFILPFLMILWQLSNAAGFVWELLSEKGTEKSGR